LKQYSVGGGLGKEVSGMLRVGRISKNKRAKQATKRAYSEIERELK